MINARRCNDSDQGKAYARLNGMDFVHDQLATGFSGADVVQVLEGVCKEMGLPATIRLDQGGR